MEIRHAKESQLLEVLYIVRECAFQLIEKGVRYWHNSHADYAEILKDITDKKVYILFYRRMAVGTITIKPSPSSSETIIVSRLAVLPTFQKRGYAKALLKFALDEAKSNSAKVIKAISPVDDTSLNKLFGNAGYVSTGTSSSNENEPSKVFFEKKL